MQACRLLDHAAFGKLELNSPNQQLHRRRDSRIVHHTVLCRMKQRRAKLGRGTEYHRASSGQLNRALSTR